MAKRQGLDLDWYYAGQGARENNNLGHPEWYYIQRRVKVDPRGPLLIDPTSWWGFDVCVITESHDLANMGGGALDRPVVVGPHAWICSNAVLYNCIIGEGAVVAFGAVVRSCEVRPWTMVAGNPAEVIARCPGKAPGQPWEYSGKKWRVLG